MATQGASALSQEFGLKDLLNAALARDFVGILEQESITKVVDKLTPDANRGMLERKSEAQLLDFVNRRIDEAILTRSSKPLNNKDVTDSIYNALHAGQSTQSSQAVGDDCSCWGGIARCCIWGIVVLTYLLLFCFLLEARAHSWAVAVGVAFFAMLATLVPEVCKQNPKLVCQIGLSLALVFLGLAVISVAYTRDMDFINSNPGKDFGIGLLWSGILNLSVLIGQRMLCVDEHKQEWENACNWLTDKVIGVASTDGATKTMETGSKTELASILPRVASGGPAAEVVGEKTADKSPSTSSAH